MRRVQIFISLLALLVSAASVLGVESATGASVVLPTVSGAFGSTPKIAFPAGSPPGGLQVKMISTGKGASVKKGELLVANYVGQIWHGKVFDSSFSRNQVASFPIGVGSVIKGWDQALVGRPLGSRVELVIPPALGYGSSGNPQAGITGTDTLVFVVDLVAAYPKTVGSHEGATVLKASSGGVSVSNVTTTAPKVTVAKNAGKPTSESVVLLAKGSGPKTTPGLLVLQFVAYDWTDKLLDSTWTSGTPDGEYVGDPSAPSEFDSLVGDPVGSRVLIELPANSNGGPYALVVQIAGEVPPGASKA